MPGEVSGSYGSTLRQGAAQYWQSVNRKRLRTRGEGYFYSCGAQDKSSLASVGFARAQILRECRLEGFARRVAEVALVDIIARELNVTFLDDASWATANQCSGDGMFGRIILLQEFRKRCHPHIAQAQALTQVHIAVRINVKALGRDEIFVRTGRQLVSGRVGKSLVSRSAARPLNRTLPPMTGFPFRLDCGVDVTTFGRSMDIFVDGMPNSLAARRTRFASFPPSSE